MSITDFSTLETIEESGGKGHNLKRLTSMGFKVPGGIVVGASFYKEHYPAPPEFDLEDGAALDKQCAAARERVLSHPLPEDLEGNIRRRLEEFPPNTRFAVRSSSTFEDLASAAFAGQHDTFLNVPPGGVLDAVKRCFASLWSPHAVLYRHHNGFAQEDASMAVVIQRMLDPESSGVVFSVDPVGGSLSHVLVEANFGVGESVVGGQAVTDSWIVDTGRDLILERRINEKKYQTVLTEEGVREKEIDDDRKEVPCLSDEGVCKVAGTAKEIEKRYGAPQDIEWALADGELFILQSRPQTRIPPRFTRDESAERFPEPLTPLTWSCVEDAFGISLEHSLALMGISLPTRPWFAMIDHYVYGNQNAVELLALNQPLDMSGFDRLREQLPTVRERFQWVIDLPSEWATNLDTFLMCVGKLSAADFENFTPVDFQDYFRELFQASTDYFRPNIAISMTQSFLTRTLFEFLLLVTGEMFEAQRLLKGIIADCGAKTGQINREIYALARMVRGDEPLLSLLAKGGSSAVAGISSFPEFEVRMQRFLQVYGHRETTFDYYIPTWCEAPEVLLDLIYVVATSQPEETEKREGELLLRRVECIRQVMTRVPDDVAAFADELIRLTRQFSWLDDMEHFQTTRINPLVRKAVGYLGRRMNLEDPHDLFFLTRREIESIDTFSLTPEMAQYIRDRKKEYLAACEIEPPWDLSAESQEEDDEDSVIKGVPGSPGVAEGAAYLVHGVQDFPGMPQGAVLVAKTTNPSWTPLFYKCSALITESGGPLSHGAVTARELGIPAVMFVKGALSRFRNGDVLRVDGQRGIVTPVDGGDQ